jgi:hypothetical protein
VAALNAIEPARGLVSAGRALIPLIMPALSEAAGEKHVGRDGRDSFPFAGRRCED